MIKCANCGDFFDIDTNKCSLCSKSFQKTSDGEGFHIKDFSILSKFEELNFWFKVRNQLIVWLVKSFGGNFYSFLEIGCGTGFVLRAIKKYFPSVQLYGSELFAEGLEFAAKRIPSATFMQMDACKLPYEHEFDCVGLFDVLEHIKEDELVLQNIYKALKGNGLLFLSVPQHQWLWSSIDEMACHVKRYNSIELTQKLQKAGFQVVFSSSFVFFLLPAMFVSRLLKFKKQDIKNELEIPTMINFIFEKILNFELFLIKKGICFPIGGSRFIVAKKEKTGF